MFSGLLGRRVMTIVAVNSGMRAELKFARNNAVLTRRREITWFICIRFERKFPRIRNEKRVKETFFADRYFSRSFLFSHPIISARRKVDGGKKERKRKETGRATVHGSITTAPTPPLAIAFHPPCFHLRVHRRYRLLDVRVIKRICEVQRFGTNR